MVTSLNQCPITWRIKHNLIFGWVAFTQFWTTILKDVKTWRVAMKTLNVLGEHQNKRLRTFLMPIYKNQGSEKSSCKVNIHVCQRHKTRNWWADWRWLLCARVSNHLQSLTGFWSGWQLKMPVNSPSPLLHHGPRLPCNAFWQLGTRAFFFKSWMLLEETMIFPCHWQNT